MQGQGRFRTQECVCLSVRHKVLARPLNLYLSLSGLSQVFLRSFLGLFWLSLSILSILSLTLKNRRSLKYFVLFFNISRDKIRGNVVIKGMQNDTTISTAARKGKISICF